MSEFAPRDQIPDSRYYTGARLDDADLAKEVFGLGCAISSVVWDLVETLGSHDDPRLESLRALASAITNRAAEIERRLERRSSGKFRA